MIACTYKTIGELAPAVRIHVHVVLCRSRLEEYELSCGYDRRLGGCLSNERCRLAVLRSLGTVWITNIQLTIPSCCQPDRLHYWNFLCVLNAIRSLGTVMLANSNAQLTRFQYFVLSFCCDLYFWNICVDHGCALIAHYSLLLYLRPPRRPWNSQDDQTLRDHSWLPLCPHSEHFWGIFNVVCSLGTVKMITRSDTIVDWLRVSTQSRSL